MSNLSWTAKRKGNTRCAPACGRGCTEAEYQQARRMAKKALSQISDKRGWKVRIWENMGWHVALEKQGLKLYVKKAYGERRLHYSTLLSADPTSGGGDPEFTLYQTFSSPQAAIDAQMRVARKHLARMKKFARFVESMTNE